ncbi:MAG: EpsG family protein [Muribaculaceae bacterium]
MIIYIIVFAAVVLTYLLTYGNNYSRSKGVLFGMMAFLALFVGMSDMLGGYDRYIYCDLFDSMCDSVAVGVSLQETALFMLYPSEFGYGLLNYTLGFVTSNRYVFILIYTLIVYILVFQSLKRYVVNYPFAVMMFLGLWFFFTFTYLRQVLAASICWLAISYAAHRKPLKFFAVVLLAYTMHNSAIVFAPLYFLPSIKFKPWVIITGLMACLAIGLTSIPAGFFEQYGELTNAEQRMVELEGQNTAGFRFEYLAEAVVFVTLIFMRYKHIDSANRLELTLANMAFVFCGILLVFVQSMNGGRLSWFYIMGVIATLTNFATREHRVSFYNLALMAMCVLLYLRILVSWGVQLSPYKTFLTDGHRDGDFIYQVYEYDNRYDEDKLYR